MTTITFSVSRDHGHYYGQPGFCITVADDGLTVEENQDLTEIRRLVDLHQNGGDVAEGDVMAGLLEEARADLVALVHRIEVADNSSGSLAVEGGEPYIKWEFPLSSVVLHEFLKNGLKYEGPVTPSAMLTEFRQRHCFETPLEFSDRGWSYTTWSGTILIWDENRDLTFAVFIPLSRIVHPDGRRGFHFQLLNLEAE